jgi:CheY-like chemotaxis protein
MGPLRILFVDDEPLLTDSAVRGLEALGGCHVEGYTSPLRALERFEQAPGDFDAVVVDQHMPGLDGPQLAARIRALRGEIRIVLFSGFHTGTPDVGHPGALFDLVFDKPVLMADLLQGLRALPPRS